MIEPKHSQFILLFLLFLPLIHHKTDAQSAIQPVPTFAARRSLDPSTAIMIAALICAFFFVGVFSLYLRHCAQRYILEQNPIVAPTDWPCSCSQGIEKKVLDTFPILVYSNIKDLKIGKGTLECAVCLSEFKDYETLRLLPKCNHAFHPECIDAWLASHDTCPVCREKLKLDSGEVAIFVPSQLNSNELDEASAVNRAEEGETEQQPAVTVANEERTIKVDEVATKRDHLPKSIISRKLSRSNSTGHSLVEPGNSVERYTLRLTEDVRRYIILNHGRIQRSASYHVIGNSKKGLYWSDCGGSE